MDLRQDYTARMNARGGQTTRPPSSPVSTPEPEVLLKTESVTFEHLREHTMARMNHRKSIVSDGKHSLYWLCQDCGVTLYSAPNKKGPRLRFYAVKICIGRENRNSSFWYGISPPDQKFDTP
jgi:hypothetical protein